MQSGKPRCIGHVKTILILATLAIATVLVPHETSQANGTWLPPSSLVRSNGAGGFTVSPSSLTNLDLKAQEDTANLSWALNHNEPGGKIRCLAGIFLIARPIVVANFQGSFVGEGQEKTFFVGKGKVLDSELPFPLVDDAEGQHVGLGQGFFPSLFLFTTSDLTPAGDPTTARSTMLRMEHMTLQMSGKTAAPGPSGPNQEAELLAHVRVFGRNGGWFDPDTFLMNGDFKPGFSLTSPIDPGDPDGPKVNEVSHAELTFVDVHFQGKNLDGASPNVFLGLFVLGSNNFLDGNPLRKPLNLNLLVHRCLFDDLSIGINSPTVYSPSQEDWAFGSDARHATLTVSRNMFFNMRLITHIADDLGDTTVRFSHNFVEGTPLGTGYSGNYLRGLLGWNFMPAVADTSSVLILANDILVNEERALGVESAAVALVEALPGFEVMRPVVVGNQLQVDDLGFYGIYGIGVHQATVFANSVTGNGAAAIISAFGDGWNIFENRVTGLTLEGNIHVFGDTGSPAHHIVLWDTNNSKIRALPSTTVFDSGFNNSVIIR